MYRSCVALLLFTMSLTAAEWELPGIHGNAPNVWKEGVNWRWDAGNPMSDKGATWRLLYQPSLTEPALKPMVAGKAYNFNFVWREAGDSFDPETFFTERTLNAQSLDGPGQGPVSAVVFTPGKAGSYRFVVTGAIAVQNPTAGNALATLAVCSESGAVLRPLKELNLNTTGGHGGFPGDFTWNETVALAAGESFAVRLQAVNPGAAEAGRCSLAFTAFTVTSTN